MFQNGTVLTTQSPLWVNPIKKQARHFLRHKPHSRVINCQTSGNSSNSEISIFPQVQIPGLSQLHDIISSTSNNIITKFVDHRSFRKLKKMKGTVVLTKKNVLDFNDVSATILDGVHELVGQKISLQLISAVNYQENGLKGKLGEPAYLEDWNAKVTPPTEGDSVFELDFDWDEEIGIPGAFIIKNNHHSEFYLKSVTIENVPGHGRIHFVCDSWVYPAKHYKTDRVFFANNTYLPHETPKPLRKYREEELVSLRGNGGGELKEWDRVYDYAYYNDIGEPDKGQDYARPILGGSAKYPYPRRGRTSQPPTRTDPRTERRLSLVSSLNIYVPRDERFGQLKLSDFLAFSFKSITQALDPGLNALLKKDFESFADMLKLYEGGIKLPNKTINDEIEKKIHLQMLKTILKSDGEGLLKFPMPQVIKEDKYAWRSDEEFTREMLAGVNPVVIRRLEEFPPKSNLNPELYGDHSSSISEEHITKNMDGLTTNEAIKSNKLFVLNYHDELMPYLRRINTTTTTKTYASRTLLFLKDDGTLKPLAIELSLPHPKGDKFGVINNVYTPAKDGVEGSIWQLAKAYVGVNDSGYHQLISHWLHTHAAIEPFVIATNRQLSVLHPIHKLLKPHFRDTMNINALARQFLINARGLFESTVFPSKYALEMSSSVYKNWVFTEQSLPNDLKKRGMAVEDPTAPHGLRLLIEDYPYAADGLEIWSAIREWVAEYCSFYYKNNEMVQQDPELQSWWKEIREEGHGDLKHEPWWPKIQTREELIESCTTIIWIGSALHAAINFGQYSYAGYLPNRPTISRRFMPEEGSPDYEKLKTNPDKVFLKTITAQLETLLGIALIEILSRHASDEVYLGQRGTPNWTTDGIPLEAFEKFGKKLAGIEERIMNMNNDGRLKNRVGPVKVPYTLLVPTSESGLTGKGVPNSVSI